MKTKNLLLLLLFVVTISTLAQHNSSFTLQGHIDGLQKGDTLFLTTYTLPQFEEENIDTFFVKQDNSFSIIQPLAHTQYFILRYTPKDTVPLPTSLLGVEILAKPNDVITLNGSTDFFGAALRKGGFYDNRLIKERDSIAQAFDKKGILAFREIDRARKNQPDSMQKYIDKYYEVQRSRSQAVKHLNDSITYKINDSEYAAIDFLRKNYDWNYTDGKERYSRFTPEVKASYYGKRILDIIEKKKMLEPGETPPDFTFTTSTGKRISLSDYNGKYLLLYWWGMCPGSIQINPYLVDMYKTYHDTGLEIIGITEQDISGFESQVQSDNEEENKKMAVFFNPLWDVVYETEKGNKEMIEPYNFNVLPTVMLISPEGKTLYRGYNDYVGLEKVFLNHLNKK